MSTTSSEFSLRFSLYAYYLQLGKNAEKIKRTQNNFMILWKV